MKRFMFVLLAVVVVLASAGALWAAEKYLVSNNLYTPDLLNGITVDELIRDNQAYNYHQVYLAFDFNRLIEIPRIDDPTIRKPGNPGKP